MLHVRRDCPTLSADERLEKLSEQALIDKNIKNYLINIEPDLIKSRLMYGFLNKRSTGKIKYFNERWFFMVSSRPLNFSSYMTDLRVLDETQIPPLLELDTIYYFIMGKEGDTSGAVGEIKTIDIQHLRVKDMTKSKSESGHAMIVDCGQT